MVYEKNEYVNMNVKGHHRKRLTFSQNYYQILQLK